MLDEYGRDIFTHIISNEAEETALKALYAIDDVNREDRYGYSYLTFAGVGHKVKVIEELLRMYVMYPAGQISCRLGKYRGNCCR